jgi:hypothetical protein
MIYHKPNLFKHVIVFVIVMIVIPGVTFTKEKKLVANREGVEVHLEPDSGSKVIAAIDAGTELMLESDRKFRRVWYYVYFPSKNSKAMRSGYIHEQDITRLYTNTTVVTLDEKSLGRSLDSLHFRKTFWGMSKSQVMASEGRGGKFIEKNGFTVIHYKENLLSQGCDLDYVFIQDCLTGAKYRFSVPLEKQDQLELNYQQIYNVIAEQYGPSEHIKFDCGDSDNISLLPNGHGNFHAEELLRRAFWSTSETEIMLLFFQNGKELILDVEYLGVEYKKLVQPKKVQTLTESN